MVEIWGRQKGESGKSFKWFTVYRDLGSGRSFSKVITKIEEMVNEMTDDEGEDDNVQEILPIPSMSQLENQSKRWHWVKRCRAWDNHLDQLRVKKREHDYLRLEDRMIDLGESILDKVEKNLDNVEFDFESKATSKSHAIKSAADAYDKAVKNIRLLYGMSTENTTGKSEVSMDIEADSKQEIKVDLLGEDFMKTELEFLSQLIEGKKEL